MSGIDRKGSEKIVLASSNYASRDKPMINQFYHSPKFITAEGATFAAHKKTHYAAYFPARRISPNSQSCTLRAFSTHIRQWQISKPLQTHEMHIALRVRCAFWSLRILQTIFHIHTYTHTHTHTHTHTACVLNHRGWFKIISFPII